MDVLNISKEIELLYSFISHIELKRPYHLNVIEELHINENGHSRILTKLLQYQSPNGKYEFLESLIYYINRQTHIQLPIQVKNPILTQEKERIDLWIRDKDGGYAIIIENKACGACDQDEQICRYIETTENYGFKANQIYIIYMPSVDDSEPSEQTWGGRKEEFANRYIKLSFRDNIIPWLEKDIVPNIRQKDNLLLTAIMQYIDYLKEFFKMNIDKNMEKEIQEQIDKILNIDSNKTQNEIINIIDKKKQEYESVIQHLNNYRNDIINQQHKSVEDHIDGLFKQYGEKIKPYEESKNGILFSYKDKEYWFRIDIDNRGWYCQLNLIDEENFSDEIWEKLYYTNILTEYHKRSPDNWGKVWKYCETAEDAIKKFDYVLKELAIIS